MLMPNVNYIIADFLNANISKIDDQLHLKREAVGVFLERFLSLKIWYDSLKKRVSSSDPLPVSASKMQKFTNE